MKKLKKILFSISPILTLILIFVVMELAVMIFNIPDYILPSPISSFRYIFENFSEMWPHIFKTFKQYFVGYPIGSVIGIALALLFIINRTANKAVSPYLTIIYCTPTLVLVPILKIFLGYGAAVCVIVCALSCFSSTMTQVLTGASMIPTERVELIQSCKGNKLQQFFMITIPSVWPSIFTGLKLGAISGLAGVIGAEMIGDTEGVGYIVRLFSFIYKFKEMFAYIYILMAVGYVLYSLICALEKKLVKTE